MEDDTASPQIRNELWYELLCYLYSTAYDTHALDLHFHASLERLSTCDVLYNCQEIFRTDSATLQVCAA